MHNSVIRTIVLAIASELLVLFNIHQAIRPHILGFYTQLRVKEILQNLIRNALYHTKISNQIHMRYTIILFTFTANVFARVSIAKKE